MTTKTLEHIEENIKANKRYLNERYKVKEIGVFGSYLYGEEKITSDLDLLVEFDEPIGLFDFIRLENELTRLTGVKVDLVVRESLKPRIKESVINEVQFL